MLTRNEKEAAQPASGPPQQLDLPIPVATSPDRMDPDVFGIFRPILLLQGIGDRLAAEQLQ